jgi:hypothetical protein
VRLLAQAVVGNRKDWQWAQVEPPLFDARHVVLLGGRHEGHTLPDPPQHWSKGNGRPLMGYLETIFEAAERLGGDVDKQLKPARDFRARADELNRQLDQARSAEEKAYGELVEAIAAGKVPPGEVAKASEPGSSTHRPVRRSSPPSRHVTPARPVPPDRAARQSSPRCGAGSTRWWPRARS